MTEIRCDVCQESFRLPSKGKLPAVAFTLTEDAPELVGHSVFVYCGYPCCTRRPFTDDIPFSYIVGPISDEGQALPVAYTWTPEARTYLARLFKKLGVAEGAPPAYAPGVYFVQGVEGGPIKIGWSKDPATRLSQLQTGNPSQLRILVTTPGAPALEQQLHALFAAHRRAGEWFDPAPELLTLIKFLQLQSDGTAKA